ncbi:MAG: hypothetical protein HY939_06445 [Gammaproteobacteria bacterium]|nr:hypothetical protein [Gammaproteobacteria bacterium]
MQEKRTEQLQPEQTLVRATPYKEIFSEAGKGLLPLVIYTVSGNAYNFLRAIYCRSTPELLRAGPLLALSYRVFGGAVQGATGAINTGIAETLGKRDPRDAGVFFWHGHTLVLIMSVPAMLGLGFAGYFWSAIGYSDVRELIDSYNFGVLPFVFLINFPNAHRMFFSSTGLYRIGLFSSLIGPLFPIATYLSVFVADFGLLGAAIVPAFYSVALITFNLSYLLRTQRQHYSLWPIRCAGTGPDLKRLLNLGVQLTAIYLAETAGVFLRTLMAGWIGRTSLVATAALTQTELMIIVISLPLSQVTNVITARAYNSHALVQRDNLIRTAKVAAGLAFALSGITFTLFLSAPDAIIRLLIEENAPEFPAILANALPLFAVSAGLQCADIARLTLTGFARGMKLQTPSTLINVLGTSGLSALLGWILSSQTELEGTLGLSLGYLAATTLTAGSLLALCIRKFPKHSLPYQEEIPEESITTTEIELTATSNGLVPLTPLSSPLENQIVPSTPHKTPSASCCHRVMRYFQFFKPKQVEESATPPSLEMDSMNFLTS